MKQFFTFLAAVLLSGSTYSQQYDFTSKSEINIDANIDISKAIQISNLDDIYNEVGLHYIGYGYWVAVGIKDNGNYNYNYPWNVTGKYQETVAKQGTSIVDEHYSKRKFKQNGKIYVKVKCTFLHRGDWNHFPIMTRSEYLKRIQSNKELLEFGLMSQSKYDEELRHIKYNIEYY